MATARAEMAHGNHDLSARTQQQVSALAETACAGEPGRGFAVVASEVRSLAGRSAEAARAIKALINASVERVAHGDALVEQAGGAMTEVVKSIQHVTDIMGEISAASHEQPTKVARVGEAVLKIEPRTNDATKCCAGRTTVRGC